MRSKQALATIVAGALMFFGVQTVDGSTSTAVADSRDAADPREVVEGVIFLSGPVAEELDTSIEEIAPEVDLEDYRADVAAVMDDLEAQEPGLIDDLAASYQSGDPVLVERALERTEEAMTAWLESEFSEHELAAMGHAQPMACSLVLACALFVVLAAGAAVAVGAAVVAGAAVAVGAWLWSDGADGTGDALARDRFVVTVAETLER